MKRWFISLYLFVLAALTVAAGWGFTRPLSWLAPAGLLLAALAPLVFFFWLATARPPRTDAHPVLVSILAGLGAVLAMFAVYTRGDTHQPFLLGAVVSLAGWLVYLRWYSKQPATPRAPVPGAALPEVEFENLDGETVALDALNGRPAVLVFYRGNWCPLCTAQIHELGAAWRRVARTGAALWFISNQPQRFSREIADRFSIPAEFLHDPGNRAARRLGIEAAGATPAGLEWMGYPVDAAVPTPIVMDGDGVVRFIEVSDNYRLRPEPETYLPYLSPAPARGVDRSGE